MNAVHIPLVIQFVKRQIVAMGIAERKQRHKTDLRDKVLKVSQKIMLNEGLSALTIRRVADEIEYSPGAIYLYFRNREEIVRELGRLGMETLLEYLQRGDVATDPAERLGVMALNYARFASEHTETYRLVFMSDSETARAVFGNGDGKNAKAGPGERAFHMLVHEFTRLRGSHADFAELDPIRVAEIYWAHLHGIASLKISCSEFLNTPVEVLVETSVKVLLAGIKS
ncbi:MAG TPA: TetR/AcrR family transcriptional regulator [Terrimicrobium sp.]